jgi:hypothetical protein
MGETKMIRTANTFRDDLRPAFGMATIAPKMGTSFDKNNDLFLGDDGVIRPRHDWQGPTIDTTKHSSVIAACFDALINYNRATMRPDDFANHYGDDPTENGFSA